MANRTRPTLEKRAKERARQEKRKQKEERRQVAKMNKGGPRPAGEEDPDIAGIVPGPQPSPWGDDEEEEDEAVEQP